MKQAIVEFLAERETIYRECKQCGQELDSDASVCQDCGSEEIGEYSL